MLQNIRANVNGLAAKIIIGLIILTFSIFGIESILVGGGSNSAAEVNGEPVEIAEVQQLVRNQTQRLIQMMGDQFNPALIDEQALQAQAIETIVNRKLLLQNAEDLGLAMPEQAVNKLITSMDQFKIDGRFSRELYSQMIQGAGFTPASFKQSLKDDLIVNQLRAGFLGTEFVTSAELKQAANTVLEKRDVRYFTLPMASVLDTVKVSDAELQSWYEQHKENYRTPETVDVSYIELSRDDFMQPISEQRVREVYEEEKDQQRIPAQRRVSHILFQQAEGESDEALNARVTAVQTALAAGADFAKQAKSVSDDKLSGAQGGDLGYTSGETLPAAMEDAVAKLELNAVSAPVVSDAGVHLIKVTDIQEERVPAFEDLRFDIERRLQNDEASRELLRVVENLRDLAYNAEDLAEPAQELELKVMEEQGVSRDQAQGLFAQPVLASQIFSEEVFEQGHNSDVVEIGDQHFVVARIKTVHPAKIQPLAAVKEAVQTALKKQRAEAVLTEQANTALADLNKGESVEAVADKFGQTWQLQLGALRSSVDVPQEVLARAFTLPAPAAGQSYSDYVTNAQGDILVLQLSKVSPAEPDRNAPLTQRLKQEVRAGAEILLNNEYQTALRENADITINPL